MLNRLDWTLAFICALWSVGFPTNSALMQHCTLSQCTPSVACFYIFHLQRTERNDFQPVLLIANFRVSGHHLYKNLTHAITATLVNRICSLWEHTVGKSNLKLLESYKKDSDPPELIDKIMFMLHKYISMQHSGISAAHSLKRVGSNWFSMWFICKYRSLLYSQE